MAQDRFIPGAKVRLTGRFLRSTGQTAGGEGQSTWTIQTCNCGLCRGGGFVATDEPHTCQENPTGYEDIPPEERPKWRHIAKGNLQVIGAPLKASDYP